jgi:hypothetical protein
MGYTSPRMDEHWVESAVREFYINSADFNGISAEDLVVMAGVEWAAAVETVQRAVRARRIDATFTRNSENAHIKRIPCLDVDGQLEDSRTMTPQAFASIQVRR